MSRWRKRAGAVAVAVVMAATVIAVPVRAQTPSEVAPAPGHAPADRSMVPDAERAAALPAGWASSADVAVTTSGDATGLHLLVAEQRAGYAWRTAATLGEPGFDTDQWIGNACLTGSGRRAVVVYAPRQFTNRETLYQRGSFAAVVDLVTGQVTKLGVTVSLAYYNPGCGSGETAVLTQSGLTGFGRTRLHTVDAVRGKVTRRQELGGQLTSAIPANGGGVIAAAAGGLVEINAAGRQRVVTATRGTPFSVHADAAGGVGFLEAHGEDTTVAKYAAGGVVRELARGRRSAVGLSAGAAGRLFLTGTPDSVAALPAGVTRIGADIRADVSSSGAVAVTHRGRGGSAAGPAGTPREPVLGLTGLFTGTGRTIEFEVPRGIRPAKRIAEGREPAPTGVAAAPKRSVTAADDDGRYTPIDINRTCAVARNDARTQVYQPYWRQVEWAADQAVFGRLTTPRPANWHESGLPSWAPQVMFPPRALATGTSHRVPAQVLLGILAQESNLWQASSLALEGDYGNPLIGNFYGREIYNVTPDDDWVIRWDKADCGYGIAQVTDGMRWTDTSRTNQQKRAIAVDYATNIAAALRILVDKWNHASELNIRINDGNPARPENWFAALWAYNTGMQPRDAAFGNPTGCRPGPTCHDGRGNFGLGWANNPINPEFPANRDPFLNGSHGGGSPDDARNPQDWPYPEKVLGWAAFPIIKTDPFAGTYEPGYRQAWWADPFDDGRYRTAVKPPRRLFCTETNHCDPDKAQPCQDADSRCWWHEPAVWKPDCRTTIELGGMTQTVDTCGNEGIRYDPGLAEPADFNQWYAPNCAGDFAPDAPAGAWVIDDVYDSMPSARPCADPGNNSGEFSLDFGLDETGQYRSKVDFHQVGGGYGGHFWSSHTRTPSEPGFLVTGAWTLAHTYHGWARVLVHVPDHGSHTGQAAYDVHLGDGKSKRRIVNQKSYRKKTNGHRWISLGVFEFAGTPRVELSNFTRDGVGDHGITWDAIAVQPLSGKPRHQVVALGDSFSSGEGASIELGLDYYPETDVDGDNDVRRNNVRRNNCHRSMQAWSRKATLKDQPNQPIGQRADSYAESTQMDYHMLACSGAQTENLLPDNHVNDFGEVSTGSDGEVSQLAAGFLDENTTLVTLSIGGNDARFGDVIEHCLITLDNDCQYTVLPGDTEQLGQAEAALIEGRVYRSVRKVLTEIHRLAPHAKIIVMGYPHLLANDGFCLRLTSVTDPWSPNPKPRQVGISQFEAAWMNNTGDILNGWLAQAALSAQANEEIPAFFADPRPGFAGKGVCGSPSLINGAVIRVTRGEEQMVPFNDLGISQQSFHPNRDGTTAYANALVETLRSPEVDE